MKKVFYIFILPILFLFIIIEIYFRFFTNYSEPYFDKETKIIKRRKNTAGIYKTKYTNTGYFRINNEGWNSHRDYFARKGKKEGKLRIAIIGHSNIEGLRIPITKTLSKVFENILNNNGKEAEIYTFGYGGMHLAQALHVGRYVVKKYQPDFIILGTSLDDFINKTTTDINFLSLKIESNGQVKEIIPKRYKHKKYSPLSSLYFLKTIKYADIKYNLGKKIYGSKVGKDIEPKHYTMLKDTVYEQKVLSGTNYILQEFRKLNSQRQIYIIEFPQYIPSYNYDLSRFSKYENSHQKKIIMLINNYHIPIINIKQPLMEDYRKNQQKFDFPNDNHYNQYAHWVIGNYLADYFMNNVLIKQTCTKNGK